MIKRLGDICEFVGGGTPSKKNPEFYGGSIPWATVRDMNVRVIESTEHSITPDAVQQSATNIIPKGEVVISTHVGLGKVCFLGQDTAINQDLKAVIPRKGLSRRYLYYWFVSKADELIANGKGATVKGVTLDFVKNLRIPVLPVREQEKVSDALDKLTHIIELSDSQIDRLDSVVKSRFVEMFGNVHDSVAIGQACVVMNGYAFKSAQYVSDGIRVIRITNVQQGYMEDPNPEFYPREKEGEIQKYMLQENDLLISLTGNVGRVALLPKEFLPAGLNQRVGCLRIRSGINLLKSYLYWALNNQTFECACIESSRGVAQKNMSSEWLKQYLIPIPPLALQREFAAFVDKVDKLAFAARQRRDVAKKMYRAKIQEFFG